MNRPINYLCVDDAGDAATYSYLDFISDQDDRLTIVPSEPEEFSSEIHTLKEKVKPDTDEGFHGLILDLRLDGEGSSAQYRAPALSQEIHTRVVENNGEFSACPLVLWSNDNKLDESYWPDDSSHDLFDLTIFKERLAGLDEKYAKKVARKLVALGEGYPRIEHSDKVNAARAADLLGISEEFLQLLDPRIVQPLGQPLGDVSVYDQARFVHRQLLTIPNSSLINSEILAARLGIDLSKMPDFDDFANTLFQDARYTGVFDYGWPCWWTSLIEKKWNSLPNCPGSLKELTAEQRVKFIRTITNQQDIEFASPVEFTSSSNFWTICQITRQPLDPMEGYVVDKQLYPWQNTQYVSMYGKRSGGKKAERNKIDPLDIERFKEDKENK